jgi:hypothetical protein
MDFDEEFSLEHLIFQSRKCRSCHKTKDLVSDFYKTRRGSGPSAYAYECKQCTKKRVIDARKAVVDKMVTNIFGRWEYPDW